LHFIPGETEWVVIFSHNSSSWGSFTYDQKEDALRVSAKPEKCEYHEWLTYDFTDRETDHATVAMRWEDLQVPMTITVPKIDDLFVGIISNELRNSPGFTWQNWDAAAQYCLTQKTHLDQGLKWAQNAVSFPFIGQENFTTLVTLSQLQEANGMAAEARQTLDRALAHRTAGPVDIHTFARNLQAQKKTDEAIRIFELNAKRYPKEWPVEVGLMRALSAKGNYKEALKHARVALAQAPDSQNKTNLERMIGLLEQGKDVN
jgi:tetratricopeptide (TPR) repeat protein